jgi:polysaccharide pyruvyl transferase CsaB
MDATSSGSVREMREPAPNDGPRILVCGWAGAGNVGDELLTRAIVELIREAGAVPVVASRDPADTSDRHGVDAVSWGLGARRAVSAVDGVVVGPGGILQDRSSLWNLPGHLAAAFRATRLAVPVAGVGVGAEPLRRSSSRRLLRRALSSNVIVTRDQESSDALSAAGLHDVTTGADLVFGLALPAVVKTGEIVVALGPSVRPGRFLPAARRLVQPPVHEIAAAVDTLATRLDAPVALGCFRGDRDRAFARDLAGRLTASSRIISLDEDDHVEAVAGARLVVSSRYHATVLALMAGVPSVIVSTEPKLCSLAASHPDEVSQLGSFAEVADADPGVRREPRLAADDVAGAAICQLIAGATRTP